jgi:Leucine-rich repeat (LRR) protein
MDALQATLQAWNQTPDMSTNLAGWNSSQLNPCFNLQSTANWKGVSCFRLQDRSDGNCSAHISGLSLPDASIVGTLPEQLGNLAYLVDLTLANNPGLSGPLPSGLSGLSSLTILDLHNCSFNGSIADELFDVSYHLVEVDLSANQFTGHLPNYGGADNLQTLNISHNKLSGPSPSNYNSSAEYGLLNATSLITV